MHDLKILYDVGKVRMQEFIEQQERRMEGRGLPESGGALVEKGTPDLTDTTPVCSSPHTACTASP
jgi:hypothetical protein